MSTGSTAFTVGPGWAVFPVSNDETQPLAGFGTIALVVRDKVTNDPRFLTCSHVLSVGHNLNDRGKMGLANSDLRGKPAIGTVVASPRGNGNDADCGLIRPMPALLAPTGPMRIFWGIKIGGRVIQPGFVTHRLQDVDRGLPVIHNGAKSAGRSGVIREISGAFNAPNSPATRGLMLIEGSGATPFAKPGDSGAIVVDTSDRIIGMVVGLRDDQTTVAMHIEDILVKLNIEV